MDCRSCTVRVRTEWCDLAGRDLDLLNAAKTVHDYDAGDEIFRAGTPCDGLRYVGGGLVATVRAWATRGPVHVNIRYPGDTLGLRSWLFGANHFATAHALEPSRICLISGVALKHLMAKNARALFCFLYKLASDLELAEERLLQRRGLSARTRLASLLMAFKASHGSPGIRGGAVVAVPLTQAQIAAAIGVAPATLSRIIGALARDGIARFQGRLVYIADPDRLRAEARPAFRAGG